MNKNEILAGLNPDQQMAVKHIKGPALVTATAGSGKTRVIISRAQNMILEGIDPSKILLTTFTNKAANEMKQRIVKAVGDIGNNITVGTFHSICNKILRRYANRINYNKYFTILDDTESDKIIEKLSKDYDLEKKYLKNFISYNKCHCFLPSMAIKNATDETNKKMATCYQLYQEELKKQMLMDYDDLLLNTVILLENNPDIKNQINNKWEYISADENQDSSDLDAKLLELLAGEKQNIFFVGDDYQGIYGFRYANIENILNLQKRYPNIKTYNLGVNYRSTNTIIEAGKSIIKNNKNQLSKIVSCGRIDDKGNPVKGLPVIQTKCKDQKDEALKIIAYINMLKNKKNIPLNKIAILFRMSHLTRTLEEALMKANINYNLVSGTPFFCRAEIQDILAYARLTLNPYDLQAFKRSVAIPKRGIGAKTINKIDDYCLSHPIGIMSIREALNKEDFGLKGKAKASIKEYNDFLKKLDQQKMLLSPKDFLMYIVKEINYYKYLEENYKENFLERIENIEELFNVAEEYSSVDDLITQASLFKEEIENENNDDAVQIMTLHKSKGLEFEAVIMTNMCEGTLPHRKSLEDINSLEEERRLAFVGVTRAENYLFMTYPQKQKIMGQWTYVEPSRFLKEIDPRLVCKN